MGAASSSLELLDQGSRMVPFLTASAMDHHGCDVEYIDRWDRSLAGDEICRFLNTVVVNRLLAGTQTNLLMSEPRSCLLLTSCCIWGTLESSILVALGGAADSGIPLAIEAALHGWNVVIPVCENIHFQSLMLHGSSKTVYIVDSLACLLDAPYSSLNS